MSLRLARPNLPSCADCQKWLYDLKTGRKALSAGRPVPRSPTDPLPCSRCPKVPPEKRLHKPTPADAQELSRRNEAAYWWYLQSRADMAGVLPQDETSVANNALIQSVIDSHDRSRNDLTPLLLALLKR